MPVIARQENKELITETHADISIPAVSDNQDSEVFNTIEPENGTSLKMTPFTSKNDIIPAGKDYTDHYNTTLFTQASNSDAPEKTGDNRWTIAALVSPTYYSGINSDHNAVTSILVSKTILPHFRIPAEYLSHTR